MAFSSAALSLLPPFPSSFAPALVFASVVAPGSALASGFRVASLRFWGVRLGSSLIGITRSECLSGVVVDGKLVVDGWEVDGWAD